MENRSKESSKKRRALDIATQRHEVSWEWIKGHAGHVENEEADELARNGMAPFKSK